MKPGDVLLVRGSAKSSATLVAAQLAIYSGARSSHVLLSLGDGAFVHSTPEGGVDFSFYPGLKTTILEDWRAIRIRDTTPKLIEEIQKAALYFIDQSYNYGFMLSGTDTSSFCSELIAKILDRSGCGLFSSTKASKITPAHFDQAADWGIAWEDVTEEYRAGFKMIDADPQTYALGHMIVNAAVRKRQSMLKSTDAILEGLRHLATTGEASEKLYETAVEMERKFREEKNIGFWNEKKYPPGPPKSDA